MRTPDAKIAKPGAAQEAFLKQLDGKHLTDRVLESLSDAYSWRRLFVVAFSALCDVASECSTCVILERFRLLVAGEAGQVDSCWFSFLECRTNYPGTISGL